MQIRKRAISIDEAIQILREWTLADAQVLLSIHFGPGQQVVLYHKGQLDIKDATEVRLISQYDHHASINAKAYTDFLEGDTDGRRWVVMKMVGSPTSHLPLLMFRQTEDGDDIHTDLPTPWE